MTMLGIYRMWISGGGREAKLIIQMEAQKSMKVAMTHKFMDRVKLLLIYHQLAYFIIRKSANTGSKSLRYDEESGKYVYPDGTQASYEYNNAPDPTQYQL